MPAKRSGFCEQTKTTECCFCRSECAETRSNGSEACTHEQYDYVSRGEQVKTTECCFYLSECDKTRRNRSKACPCE